MRQYGGGCMNKVEGVGDRGPMAMWSRSSAVVHHTRTREQFRDDDGL